MPGCEIFLLQPSGGCLSVCLSSPMMLVFLACSQSSCWGNTHPGVPPPRLWLGWVQLSPQYSEASSMELAGEPPASRGRMGQDGRNTTRDKSMAVTWQRGWKGGQRVWSERKGESDEIVDRRLPALGPHTHFQDGLSYLPLAPLLFLHLPAPPHT